MKRLAVPRHLNRNYTGGAAAVGTALRAVRWASVSEAVGTAMLAHIPPAASLRSPRTARSAVPTRLRRVLVHCFVSMLALSALAQVPPPAMPVMRETAPGIFEIGKLHLDQKALTLTFPGVLNMKAGLLEYLLVTPRGSTHESLLVSEVSPNDVHFAMLLLGAKGGGENSAAAPAQIDGSYLKNAPKLKGDTVLISVQWNDGTGEKTAPVEDWLFNEVTKKPVERGPWTYNGSLLADGRFLAQSEGCFVALVTNPSALLNNPRKGSDNDQMWGVNEKAVPPVNTPVAIIFKLIPPANQAPKP